MKQTDGCWQRNVYCSFTYEKSYNNTGIYLIISAAISHVSGPNSRQNGRMCTSVWQSSNQHTHTDLPTVWESYEVQVPAAVWPFHRVVSSQQSSCKDNHGDPLTVCHNRHLTYCIILIPIHGHMWVYGSLTLLCAKLCVFLGTVLTKVTNCYKVCGVKDNFSVCMRGPISDRNAHYSTHPDHMILLLKGRNRSKHKIFYEIHNISIARSYKNIFLISHTCDFITIVIIIITINSFGQ